MKKQIVNAMNELKAKGKSPNFLFIGDSVLHIASFNSFVKYMQEQGVSLYGVICNGIPINRMQQYDARNILGLDPNDYVYLENGTDVDLREYPQETILDSVQLLCSLIGRKDIHDSYEASLNTLFAEATSKFYVLYPGTDRLKEHIWNEALLSGKEVIRVVLEEGVGTYTQTPRTWFDLTIAKTISKLSRALKYIRWYTMLPLRKCLDRLLRQKTRCVRFCVFDYDDDGCLIANDVVAENLEKVFQTTGEEKYIEPRDFKGKVIIATTMLFEESSSQSIETSTYNKVIDLCYKNEIEVVIKPHPRDNKLDKYRQLGAEVIDDGCTSLESLLAHARSMPLAIVGMQSSSQIIANSLWGVEAIFLTDLCEEAFLNHDSNLRIRHFRLSCLRGRPLFMQFAASPKNYNELEECIVKIADKKKSVISE